MSRAECVAYQNFYQVMPLGAVRSAYRLMHSNSTLLGRSVPKGSSLQKLLILWRILWKADQKLRLLEVETRVC